MGVFVFLSTYLIAVLYYIVFGILKQYLELERCYNFDGGGTIIDISLTLSLSVIEELTQSSEASR